MHQTSLIRQRAGTSVIALAADKRGFMARTFIAMVATIALTALFPVGSVAGESENIRIAKAMSGAFAEVVEQVGPAVVGIETERIISSKNRDDEGSDILDPFFDMLPPQFRRRFSPDNTPQEPQRRPAYGSGVIIDREGHILTNNHVVADADSIKVELAFEPGKPRKAEIVGRDPNSDIAVIKLVDIPENLPFAVLGDSDSVKPGNIIIAIGAPLGFKQSVTMGIVSALGRNLGEFSYERFIQTDAAINRGNSGGPLINLDGEVIGINTMISTSGISGGSIGIGFAIPMSQGRTVINQLIEKGSVTRGWLGIVMNPEDPEISRELGHDGTGVLITDIDPAGPAAKAGIRKGDLIISFDNIPIKDNEHLRYLVADTTPGRGVPVTVYRAGKKVDLSITIEAQPEDMFTRNRLGGDGDGSSVPGSSNEMESPELKITVQDLNDAIRQKHNIPDSVTGGVVVTKVESGSEAEEKGIRPGTVILEMGHLPIKSVKDFTKQIDENKGNDKILMYLRAGQIAKYVMLKIN